MSSEGSVNGPAVTGIVLAGGRSTRFGDTRTNKATATLGERTLLERVSSAVGAATDRPPVIVARTEAQRRTFEDVLVERDVVFSRDDPSFEGPLAGVIGAIRSVDTPWVFVCGCDMPLLSADAIRWLRSRLDRVETTSPDAVALEHPDGTVEPMHTLYRRAGIRRARRTAPPDGGVRAVLSALDTVRSIPTTDVPGGIPLADSLANVNTRAELATIARRESNEGRRYGSANGTKTKSCHD